MKESVARLSDILAAASNLGNIPILCNNTHFILFFKNRCDTLPHNNPFNKAKAMGIPCTPEVGVTICCTTFFIL